MSLWFVVPAHGRLELSRICLRQLRRTCDALTDYGIEATAVVIACDENLDTARELGFGTVERSNKFVSARFNDGLQLACDPEYNPRPAEYAVPCGSDDWTDWRLFTELPPRGTVVGFPKLSFVRQDGAEIALTTLLNPAGCGVRIYPRDVLALSGYRPADEDRYRGCDTSILTNTQRIAPVKIEHRDTDPRQIVDWKSPTQQLNGYEGIVRRHRAEVRPDPFGVLAGVFPEEALEEMQAHYFLRLVAA